MSLSAEDRKYLASKGVCTSCGKRPAMPGLSECNVCRERAIVRDLEKKNPNADAKICPKCGKEPRAFAFRRCWLCMGKTPKEER